MITARTEELPFVVFRLKEELYAVSARYVQEILQVPPVTPVPNASKEVRGVINLRGRIIPLIDLRIKLGLTPLRVELDALIQLLHDREKDHRDWLNELENCVREHRSFRLARDPHQCKFGVWYDHFKTGDRLLRMTLPSMDRPHRAIHATADEALRLSEQGDTEGALGLIAERRDHELAALINLFEASRRTLVDGHREVAVVLACGDRRRAFCADMVEAAEPIPAERIEPLSPALAGPDCGLDMRAGQRSKTDETILLVDGETLCRSAA